MSGEPRQDERAALPFFWGLSVFVAALAVRLSVFFLHGRSFSFQKYTEAAHLLVQNKLGGAQILDFSPLYLEMHRFVRLAGLTNIDALRAAQAVIGAAACVLVASLGAKISGRAAGITAGLIAALQRDLVMYDQVLEPETVLVFLALAAIVLVHPTGPENMLWRAGGSGLAVGLAMATRPTAATLVPVVLAALLPPPRQGRWKSFLSAAAVFLLILGSTQAALHVRNQSYGADTEMSPWQVFYTGNNPEATGIWRPDRLVKDLESERSGDGPDIAHSVFREVAVAEGASARNPDAYWGGLAWRFIGAYPLRYLRLLGEKALAIGQHHDPHDIASVFRLQEIIEGWPLVDAWLVVAFGLTGFVLQHRRLRIVALAAAMQALVCVGFFVSVRYKLLLIPWLCIAAATVLGFIWRRVRRFVLRSPGGAGNPPLPLVALVLSFWVVLFWLPLPPGMAAAQEVADLRRARIQYGEARALARSHLLVQAGRELERCGYVLPWDLQYFAVPKIPFSPVSMARKRAPDALIEATRSGAPRDWLRLGFLLDFAGRREEAAGAYEQVERSARWPGERPTVYAGLIRKGLDDLALGDAEQARRAFREASRLQPGAPEALVGVAMCSTGPPAEAALAEARRVNPSSEVLYHLGRMNLECGFSPQAVAPLARLVEGLPRYARGRMLYAVALGRSGRLGEAAGQATEAHRIHHGLRDLRYSPLEILEQAALQHSGDWAAWRYLAVLAAHYGEFDIALAAWRRLEAAGALLPGDRISIASLLFDHERPAEAIPYLEASLNDAPTNNVLKDALDEAHRRAVAERAP